MPATATAAQGSGHAEHTKAADQQIGLPGKFDRPLKIVLLGAGSGFTPTIVRDILMIDCATRGEIALVDIEPSRLEAMRRIIKERLIPSLGRTGWTVSASTNRRDVLAGADYVTCCIEVSGLQCVAWDNDIPLKYGVDQCIGDTIGPGGLFKALRTVPVYLEVLRDMEDLCPRALVLNYTNPMSIMCLAAGRSSPIQTVGLCHSIQGASHKLAKDAGVPYEQMTWEAAGINHMAWFTKLEHQGRDLYPVLFEKVKDHTGDVYESDPVRYDMMLHFGAFMTESSGHLSEYLPYYRKRPELVKKYCRDQYRGGSRFYASSWPGWRKWADEQREKILRGEAQIELKRSWEYASWIIEAREKDTPFRIYGNVMNTAPNRHGSVGGELITNLPGDGCVEVACMVDRNGINPTRYGALPRAMAHLCASNMAMFDLAAEACIHKSKEAAIHALMLDPLTAAVCCPEEIKQMTLELFEAEKDYLPGYK